MCELFTQLYLGGEKCGCGEQMMAGFFAASLTLSWTGVRKVPRILWAFERLAHTQPAKSSDAGVLGGHLLATRGARSRADGCVRASGVISLFEALDPAGNKTLRSGESCERRLPFLGTAYSIPKKKPGPANPSNTTILDTPNLNGLEDLFLAMSSAHGHRPVWNFTYLQVASALQQASAKIGLGRVTVYQLRRSGAIVDVARQYRELDAVQKRGVWSQAKSMHRNEQSSRIAADNGQLAPEVQF